MTVIKKKRGNASAISGKTVVYELNGKLVGRRIGKNNMRSLGQLKAQQSMGLLSVMVSSMINFINIGFRMEARKLKKSAFNLAISVNYDCAHGDYPDVELDYTKVVVSKGSVFEPSQPQVRLIDKKLEFTWADDLSFQRANASDHVMLLAYYPEVNEAVFILSGERRDRFKTIMSLPNIKNVTRIETYIAFISANQKNASNSVYTGSVFI